MTAACESTNLFDEQEAREFRQLLHERTLVELYGTLGEERRDAERLLTALRGSNEEARDAVRRRARFARASNAVRVRIGMVIAEIEARGR